MASVYGIIRNHDVINVYSEKGEVTTFNIYLPASDKTVRTEDKMRPKILKGSETVLLIDDEDMVIDVGIHVLERLGYTALVARSGHDALAVYEQNRNSIDLVILDLVMPEMGGGETYDRLKALDPDITVLLSSGYSLNEQADDILKRGCNGFIQKPFSMAELSRKLREVLDRDPEPTEPKSD